MVSGPRFIRLSQVSSAHNRRRHRFRSSVFVVIRIKTVFFAFRQALKDIAADIRNVPANYKTQRLMVDGLKRHTRQHYERKRVAGQKDLPVLK